jgi:DNA-binding winged helix-turn-helix (wHTH) protein
MSGKLIGFRFGDFEVDLARRELRRRAEPVHLEPRVFDLLAYLLAHRGRLVPRDELIAEIWRLRFVSDDALSGAVAKLRRAVGDRREPRRFVRTAYGHGYGFVATATEIRAACETGAMEAAIAAWAGSVPRTVPGPGSPSAPRAVDRPGT